MGPVVTSAAHPAYLGARKHTNNTAELTALAELLRALLSSSPQRAGSRGVVRTDSEYAAACMMGRVTPKTNRQLAERLRTRCDPPHASTSRCVWREGVARGNEGAPLAVCSFWGSPVPSCMPPRTRYRSALLRVIPLVAVTRIGEPGGARLGRLVPPCCWYAFARRGRLGVPPK